MFKSTPIFALTWLVFVAFEVHAHGPQIQITNDNGKIVTRSLLLDAPYSEALTAPKSAYVIPMAEWNGVWYSRPNQELDPILGTPRYFSGPGFTYGYDQVDGGPQAFGEGSVLSVTFTSGLKRWDGTTFGDAGDTEIKAFRGSNVAIAMPPENFAITSDLAPFDNVSLASVEDGYGIEGAETHNTLRFALLGDGNSPTSASLDGVYLLSMQLSSSDTMLAPSDEYYFLLHKNAASSEVAAAVSALGVPSNLVQIVPEPSALMLGLLTLMALGATGPYRAQRSMR